MKYFVTLSSILFTTLKFQSSHLILLFKSSCKANKLYTKRITNEVFCGRVKIFIHPHLLPVLKDNYFRNCITTVLHNFVKIYHLMCDTYKTGNVTGNRAYSVFSSIYYFILLVTY